MCPENVLNELRNFHKYSIEIGKFNSSVLQQYMEPIFEREKYRDENLGEKNILIITDAGAGDFILLSPSIRAIRNAFPNDRITLVCSDSLYSLARTCPYVDSIFYNKNTGEFELFDELIKWQIEFSEQLLPFRFDLAICFCHQIGSYMLAYMSGAKIIAGYQSRILCDSVIWPFGLVNHLINFPIEVNILKPHMVHRYIGIVEGISNQKINDLELEIWFEPRCMKFARQIFSEHGFLDKPIFAIVMGGTSAKKHYPPEKYAELAQLISEEIPDARFVILGDSKDIVSGEIFSREFGNPDRVLDLSGKINLAETSAILSMCSMYIGNDTGTMHVAAAVEIPCLAPFCYPADKPIVDASVIQMYYPYGVPAIIVQPRQSLPECIDSHEIFFGCQAYNQPHCITQIEVETMFAGFHLLLEKIQNNDSSVDLIC